MTSTTLPELHGPNGDLGSHRRRLGRVGAVALSGALLGVLGGLGGLAGQASATTTPTDPTVPTVTDPAAPTETAAPASPDPAAPVAVPASFTLPLFGAGLTVDITTGPGGALSSVMLNPADGYTAVTNRPNKVAFVNEDGTAKVVVKSGHGGQRVEARAGSLAEIVGPGGWSGEVFPGVPGSVAFEIVDAGGAPDIVVGEVTGPSPEIGTVERSSEQDDDGDGDELEQEAKVKIRFSQDGQSRWLTIKAEVETDDDGSTHAKVQISLSKIRTAFTDAEAIGQHTWEGLLCSGESASITFTVAEDGTLTVDQVTPSPERQKVEGNGVEVRFADGEKVRIRVRNADGTVSVKVDDKIRCDDAPDPTLNVPVASADDDDDDDHGSDHGSDHDDDDDDDDDDDHREGRGGNRGGDDHDDEADSDSDD
jgi:hypothetical protein